MVSGDSETAATARDATINHLVRQIVDSSGGVSIRVKGSSMLPAVLPGDVLVIQREKLRDLTLGDIAVFSRHGRLFAHRVVKTGAHGLITRGDSLPEDDLPVYPDELLGRVAGVFRGKSRIALPRSSSMSRAISVLFRQSEALTTLLLWFLNRVRVQREGGPCRV